MATTVQFVPTEVPFDFDVPQREAAFFYGLFLRGHSAEQLRRDIEVPPAVLAKWHRDAEREPELRDIFFRMVEYRRRGPDSSINGRGAGELLAVALTDVLSDGLSMVYSFFESGQASRSLGTFMILDHIARARAMGLAYVYLGYWVAGSRKMDYKGRFMPQERLTPEGWKRVEK